MLSVEEKDTAVRQRDWLLEDIIPTMLNKSLKELEKSVELLTNSSKIDSLPLTQNETIKGFLTLNGTCINKAELIIKLPHQETAIKASIVGSVPYFLEQLQQTNNYLLLASDRVKSFKTPTNQQSTVGLLEDLYGYVNRALHALDYPNEASLFPYKVCHPKFFTPPLKQDTAIEFCIQDVFVTCNLYALDYQVKPNKTDSVV